MNRSARCTRRFSLRETGFFMIPVLVACLFLSLPPAYGAGRKSFASPEEAVDAFLTALKGGDPKALAEIFGPGNEDLVSSGDEVDDRARREEFLKAAGEQRKLSRVGETKVLLSVGAAEWPFPIPITRKGKGWYFNTKVGRQEIIDRRIGRNELGAIETCLAYVDVQREYALLDLDRDGLFEYAEKFVSEPGQKDGLYWEAKEGEKPSPLGAFVAAARAEGYSPDKPGEKPAPYHGYYYRILLSQGKHAQGGAYNYKVDGKMIGGFALVAYPARWGTSGIMTFMVNHNGVVFQKNLGKKTEKIARAMKAFDPDKTWQKADR